MNKPSAKQREILVGLAGRDKVVTRDDSGPQLRARWYFDRKRIGIETAKVLYCRGWIEQKARRGLFTLYTISEAGRTAIEKH